MLVLWLVLLIAGGGVFVGHRIWGPPGGGTAVAQVTQSKPADAPGAGRANLKAPLHQPRLNVADRRAMDADPAMTVAADPENLDKLTAWAALDPDAALAWINSHAGFVMCREHLLGAVAAGILIRDGAEAMNRFLAMHQEDPEVLPKNQGELLKYAMFMLGRADSIDAALSLLQGDDADSLAGMMVLGMNGSHDMTRAVDYLEAMGIPVGVDYWAFQSKISEDPRYWADWAQQRDSNLLVEIVHGWSRDEPADARAWCNERLPVTDSRRQEIEELLNAAAAADDNSDSGDN